MNEEKIQEKYMIFQLLQQNLEALRQHQEMVRKQMEEIAISSSVLKEMSGIKKEDDILIPLGGGCFGTGSMKDNRNVVVDIGAGILINKDVGSATEFLESRQKELERVSSQLNEEMNRVAAKMNEIGSEIQSISGEEQTE